VFKRQAAGSVECSKGPFSSEERGNGGTSISDVGGSHLRKCWISKRGNRGTSISDVT